MIRISAVIENTCKKLGVKYISPHHDKILERTKDAQTLASIYIELKEIMGKLEEIENKYPKLKKIIEIDLKELNEIEHHLTIEAHKIMRRKNEL